MPWRFPKSPNVYGPTSRAARSGQLEHAHAGHAAPSNGKLQTLTFAAAARYPGGRGWVRGYLPRARRRADARRTARASAASPLGRHMSDRRVHPELGTRVGAQGDDGERRSGVAHTQRPVGSREDRAPPDTPASRVSAQENEYHARRRDAQHEKNLVASGACVRVCERGTAADQPEGPGRLDISTSAAS